MKHIYHTLIISLSVLFTTIMAQGIPMPDTPSQAPIGGLGLLAAAGGALAYKKLKDQFK